MHPIIRLYRNGEVLTEQHLVENLEADWEDAELHVEPLEEFIGNMELPTVSA